MAQPVGLRALERQLEDEQRPIYEYGRASGPSPKSGLRALERHIEDTSDLFGAIRAGDYARFRKYSSRSAEEFHQRIRKRVLLYDKLHEEIPDSFQGPARRSLDAVPAHLLFDFASGASTDDEFADILRAYTLNEMRPEIEAALPEGRMQASARMGFLVALDSDEQRRIEQAVALGDLLGITDEQTGLQKAAMMPSQWFDEKILQSEVVEKLIQVSEAPARALDWIARQVPGDHVTAGQLLASPLKDVSPAAYNVISGTADAIKVLSLDTFLLFGKPLKAAKVARGSARIGEIDDINRILRKVPGGQRILQDPYKVAQRGIASAPMQRFVNWYADLPDTEKTVGAMGRISEQLGWLVEPRVWQRLRSYGQTPKDVQGILVEEMAGVGGVERLPWMPIWRPARDAVEEAFNPLVRATRLTWGFQFDVAHPQLEKMLRRFGDYAYGVKGLDDAHIPIIDNQISDILIAPNKGLKADKARLFYENGLRQISVRAGVDPKLVDEAVEAVQKKYPQSILNKREGLYGFQPDRAGNLRKIDFPYKQTHLDSTVPVFSYPEILAFKQELKRLGGKDPSVANALTKLDEGVGKIQASMVRWWLARPGLGAKIALEEVVQLSGHHEYGRDFRRMAGEAAMDAMAHVPFVGSPLRRFGPKIDLSEEIPRDIQLFHTRNAWADLLGKSENAALAKEYADLADEIDKVNPTRWIAVKSDETAFIPAWYHQVNHALLQDPLTIVLLENWSDPDRYWIAKRWLTRNSSYHRQFKRLNRVPADKKKGIKAVKETVGEQEDRLIKWISEDIQQMLPGSLVEKARVSLLSGQRVSAADLEAARAAGIAPKRVIGPAPVDMMPLASHEKHKITGYQDKMFQWSGQIVDHFSRKPGFRAAKAYRTRELKWMQDEARARGAKRIISDAEIETRATEYAHREMWRLDNPVERSRADYIIKNILMFSHAQTSFLKRWSRTFAHNPVLVSRARQFVGGAEDLGFIEKDENGNLVWRIPLTPEAYTWMVNREGSRPPEGWALRFRLGYAPSQAGAGLLLSAPTSLLGAAILPPGIPFYAQTDYGFGPSVTVPVSAVTAAKPGFDWLRNAVLGGYENWQASGELETNAWNIVKTVIPSYAQDLLRAFTSPQGDAGLIHATKEVVAFLDFAEKRDPHSRDTWNHAKGVVRGMYVLSAVSKWLFPYSILPAPVDIQAHRERFDELEEEFGYEVARLKFFEEQEGKGWPMLASLSEAQVVDPETGKPMDPVVGMAPTRAARDFYRSNQDFFDKYPLVAGMFTFDKEEEFDAATFRRMTNSGQYHRLTLWEVFGRMNIKAAAKTYYEELNPELEAALAAGADPSQIAVARKAIHENLNKLYPGWLAHHNEWSARRWEKKAGIEQLYEAAEDRAVSKVKGITQLRAFLADYRMAEVAARAAGYKDLDTQKGTRQIRAALAQRYRQLQAESYSGPLEQAYSYLFRGLLEEAEDD